VAVAFEKVSLEEREYFQSLKQTLEKKRDKLCSTLSKVGLVPVVPQGSYFVLADTSKINPKLFMNPEDPSSKDYQFCRWLTKEIGVAAIPPTAFYSPQHAHLAQHLARFCFCKKDETLEEAGRRLQKLLKVNL
jgi:aspartate/methionine/tyrosine aminotransferase